jgi:hypothetical protein
MKILLGRSGPSKHPKLRSDRGRSTECAPSELLMVLVDVSTEARPPSLCSLRPSEDVHMTSRKSMPWDIRSRVALLHERITVKLLLVKAIGFLATMIVVISVTEIPIRSESARFALYVPDMTCACIRTTKQTNRFRRLHLRVKDRQLSFSR